MKVSTNGTKVLTISLPEDFDAFTLRDVFEAARDQFLVFFQTISSLDTVIVFSEAHEQV